MDRPIEPEVQRRRVVRRIAVATLAVAAVLLLGTATVNWLRPSVKRRDIQTARVEVGRIDATLQANGTVVPAYEQAISSPVEARVMRIDHRAGDRLTRGDEILTLDTAGSRLDVDRLSDQVRQKESELAELRLKLEDTAASTAAQIEQKKLDRDILRFKSEQNDRMYAGGIVAEQDKLSARTAAKKADIEIAQLEAGAERARRSAEAQVAAEQSQVATAQRELGDARHQLDLAMTRADRDGVLTWVVPDVGATIRKGDVVARVADLSAYRVLASISDVHASKLAAGMPARVAVDDTTTLDGVITSIDPRIDNGIVKFYVDLDDTPQAHLRSHPKLHNNLRVDVFVVTGRHDRTLRVQRGSLGQSDREDVFVVRGDRLLSTPVRWGLASQEKLEVGAGLHEGDEVVISNMSDYAGIRTVRLEER
jgi:HlyD family secretion protein